MLRIIICSLFLISFAPMFGQGVIVTHRGKSARKIIELEGTEKLELIEKSQEKLESFLNYVQFIGKKEKSNRIKDFYIDEALKLFIFRDKNTMEASSATTGKKWTKNMDVYLRRLKSLSYDKINIKFYKVPYVSNLERQPDGTYRAIFSYIQEFSGYRSIDGQDIRIYKDFTHKTYEVIIQLENTVDGKDWIVYLGDIYVEETQERFRALQSSYKVSPNSSKSKKSRN